MTIPFKKLKDEWMKHPAFRAEYGRLKPEFTRALARIKNQRPDPNLPLVGRSKNPKDFSGGGTA
jgi:hypothetical protein